MDDINDSQFIPAKKSLGQNFLISSHAIDTIIEAGKITKDDIVVEVGPGKGALTTKLLETAGEVFIIEKDDRLIPVLSEMFAMDVKSGKLKVIHADALHFKPKDYGLEAGKYKIMANIPYYITGSFFRKFLAEETQPNTMVIMVQKEVATRIARDPKESILSMSVKCYGTPSYISTVSKNLFRPVPNVDSAILAIYDISKKYFDEFTEEDYFRVVKTGFAHKRKQLAGNLSEIFPKKLLIDAYASTKLPEYSRAEDLTLEEWKKLIKALN